MQISLIFQRFNVLNILLLLLITGLAVACEKPAEKKLPPSPVSVLKLQSSDIEDYNEYVATLISRKTTNLYPREPGPIIKINVHDGDLVKKGTLIMSIESSAQAETVASNVAGSQSRFFDVKQAKKTLDQYKADLASSESQYELSKIEYDRYYALYKDGSATKADFDTYNNQYKQSIAQVAAAKDKIKAQQEYIDSQTYSFVQAKATAKSSKATLGYYSMFAPYDGIIGYIPVRLGQYVDTQTQLTNIVENNPLEVQIPVDNMFKSKLSKDKVVKIYNQNYGNLTYANIIFIAPNVDQSSQTILVNAHVDNSKGLFRVNELVKARIIWKISKGILVPTNCVINFSGQNFVFYYKKEKDAYVAKKQPIQVSGIQDNCYIVTKGLKVGDVIITTGVQKVKDGTPVAIVKPKK